MSSIDRKRELFHHVVRLRRVERQLPQSRDVVAVRAALERELGETLSQRLAANLLGVSHTALRHWVHTGDVPLVQSRAGRPEVPLQVVVELYEAIQRRPKTRGGHVLEPLLVEGRRRADRLRTDELVPADDSVDPHERSVRRALAYHRALGQRLRRSMVDEARHRLWQWRDEGKIDDRYADEWERVLARPVADVRRIVGEDTPAGRDLRQTSPFAGMLSEPERRRIIEQVG